MWFITPVGNMPLPMREGYVKDTHVQNGAQSEHESLATPSKEGVPIRSAHVRGAAGNERPMHVMFSTKAACLLFAVVIVLVVVFDQMTKALVRASFDRVGDYVVVVPGLFNFQLVHNTGAAFGMFAGRQIYFILMAVVISVFAVVYLVKSHHHSVLETVTLALIVSGAIGNVIDRIMNGYVTDFIATAFVDFPVFNVADCAITIGCALFALSFVLGNSPRIETSATKPTDTEDTCPPATSTHGDTDGTR
jgi:signal peptidase II